MADEHACAKRGFLHEAWAIAGDTWTQVSLRAEDCPRMSASFLEEERRTMGERIYRQEYGCEFGDATSGDRQD